MTPKSAVLLVGSAKQPHSTSERLAEHLAQRLDARGVASRIVHIHRTISSETRQRELVHAINGADLVVLAFPLYVDTLPYLVTRTLEQVAASARGEAGRREQALLAIANCGFPEAHQNDLALAVCRQFARQTGFRWAGGMGLGAGETIHGRSLPQCGPMARHVMDALDLAADALAEGKSVPPQAVQLMAKPLVPTLVYRLFGELGWQWRAHRRGVRRQLKARPYEG